MPTGQRARALGTIRRQGALRARAIEWLRADGAARREALDAAGFAGYLERVPAGEPDLAAIRGTPEFEAIAGGH